MPSLVERSLGDARTIPLEWRLSVAGADALGPSFEFYLAPAEEGLPHECIENGRLVHLWPKGSWAFISMALGQHENSQGAKSSHQPEV